MKTFAAVYTERIIPYVRSTRFSIHGDDEHAERVREYAHCKELLGSFYARKLEELNSSAGAALRRNVIASDGTKTLAQLVAIAQAEALYFAPKTSLSCSLYVEAPNIFQFDADNVYKTITDAANGVVFDDDRYIVSVSIEKHRRKQWRTSIVFSEHGS